MLRLLVLSSSKYSLLVLQARVRNSSKSDELSDLVEMKERKKSIFSCMGASRCAQDFLDTSHVTNTIPAWALVNIPCVQRLEEKAKRRNLPKKMRYEAFKVADDDRLVTVRSF